jgi:predicted nuclease of predicted toxin-antitoxin system
MLRFLADENLKGDITRGLLRREPDLDLLRVQDVGLLGAQDPEVLEWAAEHGRILLSHDQATLPDFAYDRMEAGEPMPGVFVVPRRLSVRQAIEEILLLAACSELSEWSGRVLYLPL